MVEYETLHFLTIFASYYYNLLLIARSNSMSEGKNLIDSMAQVDMDLIQRAQGGDSLAFEQLVFRYDKQVLSIAARYVNSAEEAKDIYQEVFLRVYRSLSKFELRSEFSTWLFRITTNVCLTHRSRRKRHSHTSIDNESDEEHGSKVSESLHSGDVTDQQAEGSDIAFHIQQAVELLSPKQKMVFTLKHYEGYKLKEIAEMMDCAEGTVKKYLFTATRRIREELKDLF